jgi:hypothetical protein
VCSVDGAAGLRHRKTISYSSEHGLYLYPVVDLSAPLVLSDVCCVAELMIEGEALYAGRDHAAVQCAKLARLPCVVQTTCPGPVLQFFRSSSRLQHPLVQGPVTHLTDIL